MNPTVIGGRDRSGHTLLLACSLVLAMAATLLAASREYRAERFNAAITVLPGGDVEVAETVSFDFQSGSFEKVWRDIPAQRTDGIEILDATMDDVRFSTGDGPGHITVRAGGRTRVEWRFTPVGPSSHTFGLKYRARGVAYTDERGDVIAWRALPTDHQYRIDSSHVTLETPRSPVRTPVVDRPRVGMATIAVDERVIDVRASQISRNGWIEIETVLPPASVVSSPPAWRANQMNAAALAPRWMSAAGAIAILGILLVLAVRHQYDRPSIVTTESTATSLPERLPPALAGALVENGRAHVGHALATVVDLADRGVLIVRELPRHLGPSSYELTQVPGKHTLRAHEETALTIAFAGRPDEVTLARARARLARGSRRFSQAVANDLAAEGLLDAQRKAVRDHLLFVGILLLMGGAVSTIPMVALVQRYGPWPLLLSLACVVAGLAGIIASATTTALSNEGLMRAAPWRGFKRHLKNAISDRPATGGAPFTARDLSYAIALGLGTHSSRYLKRHPGMLPPWFASAARGDDGAAAFAAFVGSSSHPAGAHGAGAAAGGGSSGAA